jgi:hypothetical protein
VWRGLSVDWDGVAHGGRQQRVAQLEMQLSRMQGEAKKNEGAGKAAMSKEKEWAIEKEIYAKRELAWEAKSREHAAQLSELEEHWRGRVEAAMADMSAHPALETLRRENARLQQEVMSLTAQVSECVCVRVRACVSGGHACGRAALSLCVSLSLSLSLSLSACMRQISSCC